MTVDTFPAVNTSLAFVTFWLLLIGLGRRLRLARGGWLGHAALVIVPLVMLLVPFKGLPLWSWAYGVFPNPSIPLIGLLLARTIKHLFDLALYERADWRATWIFGAVLGTVIYPASMLGGEVDLYYWGWDVVATGWTMAGAACAFIAFGNRFGVVLLCALGAFVLSGLESSNGWDYVVDPVYWLASVAVLVRLGVGRLVAMVRARRTASALVPLAAP